MLRGLGAGKVPAALQPASALPTSGHLGAPGNTGSSCSLPSLRNTPLPRQLLLYFCLLSSKSSLSYEPRSLKLLSWSLHPHSVSLQPLSFLGQGSYSSPQHPYCTRRLCHHTNTRSLWPLLPHRAEPIPWLPLLQSCSFPFLGCRALRSSLVNLDFSKGLPCWARGGPKPQSTCSPRSRTGFMSTRSFPLSTLIELNGAGGRIRFKWLLCLQPTAANYLSGAAW